MGSHITKVAAVRIRNEVWEYFHGKPLNKTVESVYDLVKEERIGIEGNGKVIIRDDVLCSDDKRKNHSILGR